MRNIINMIIKIAIIWGAAWLFPEHVKVQDKRTMVLVVATLLIASIVLTVIMMGVLILAALPGNGVGIGIAMLTTIIMALASGIKGEYTVTEPLFNPLRGILWKNNVCKLRAHFRTDDKNIKVLKSLKGVDITPEVPEE